MNNAMSGGNDPTTAADAGNGFLMRQGYTILWAGWDATVPAGGGRFTIQVPVAQNADGTTLTGTSLEEFVIDDGATLTGPLTYPAATADKSRTTLTVRAATKTLRSQFLAPIGSMSIRISRRFNCSRPGRLSNRARCMSLRTQPRIRWSAAWGYLQFVMSLHFCITPAQTIKVIPTHSPEMCVSFTRTAFRSRAGRCTISCGSGSTRMLMDAVFSTEWSIGLAVEAASS